MNEDLDIELLENRVKAMYQAVAALEVGPSGQVVGIDMIDAQLNKAHRLTPIPASIRSATARATSSAYRPSL